MLENLRLVFNKISKGNCIDSEVVNLFRVNDPDTGPCYIHRGSITDEAEKRMFIVHNNDKRIHFVAIDKCLIQEESTRTCDFALFDDSKFAFIELKLNVTTSKLKNADDTREGALNQLFRTLIRFNTEFLSKGIEFDHPNIYVIVAMPPEAPRDKTTSKMIADFFLEKYGYEYEEARQISFY